MTTDGVEVVVGVAATPTTGALETKTMTRDHGGEKERSGNACAHLLRHFEPTVNFGT